jgi:hypothetical protein
MMDNDEISPFEFKHPVACWLATEAKRWLKEGPLGTRTTIADELLARAKQTEAENCRDPKEWECRQRFVVQLKTHPNMEFAFELPDDVRRAAWNPPVVAEWRAM